MNQLINLKCVILIPLVLAWFALLPNPDAFGVVPAPGGGYPNNNTAEGTDALFSLTNGDNNTAIGFTALYSNTGGGNNTAVGEGALFTNTTGNTNTGIGYEALNKNKTGYQNTATGWSALWANTSGYNNTATGNSALHANTTGYANTGNGLGALGSNITGYDNTANGYSALGNNTIAFNNTATGFEALFKNITGLQNTATGANALLNNTAGGNNTAAGYEALRNTTGNNNIAIGSNLTTGSNNIDIGTLGGVAAESSTIRVGTANTQTKTFIAGIHGVTTAKANGVPVVIDSAGQLGTVSSSERFKKQIKRMDQVSEAILALKPVTFQYGSDSTNTPQFGLIAEEVAKVNQDLVVRDADGEIYTVRYEAVNAMLLNEFLKEHRKVQELEKRVEELTAGLQKVNAQIEMSRPARRVVDNNE
jgi:hypothetical protein